MNDNVLFAGVPKSLLGICFIMLEQNDPGHRLPHIRTVIRNGITIAEHYGLSTMPFKLAGITHDIFSSIDRTNHHSLAGQWVRDNFKNYPGMDKYSNLVARMCEEHRSSYQGKYSGLFEEAFAAADRGVPAIEDSVVRSFSHHAALSDAKLIDTVAASIAHLRAKFGEGGYNKPNQVHTAVFGNALERFKDSVMMLNTERYIHVLEKHNLV